MRAPSRRAGLVAIAGLSYLLLGVLLWGHAWTSGASTHALCGCGDPALFLWFFQWPATAIAHGHNPLYSTALFPPHGFNLLSQTSVLGFSVPLIPVTWIWGPVASLNVASTLAPALSAFCMFVVLRRWVKWVPAAYIGGLVYGFSPSVLGSLQFSHLMTAAVMLLPLIVAALDEIFWRQQYSARAGGLVLGVLFFLQFFFSSELLAMMVLVTLLAMVILVGVGLIFNRARLKQLAPHAIRATVIASVVGSVLLAYPVWFALEGPAHLSGLIWPNLGALGGYDGSSFVSPDVVHSSNVYSILGGYEGVPLPSAAYVGWGFLGVLTGGLVVWYRDRRLWFFGAMFALCVGCSFGERDGEWEPVRVLAHIPVVENIIVQRFMIFGFMAAAFMLAIILEHARHDVPRWMQLPEKAGHVLGIGVALGMSVVALLPIANAFADELPFAMQPVSLPRWYTEIAPNLPANRVLLTYPAPFSGIQTTLAWQAVDAIHFGQAGGGGPQGVANRAGKARAGFTQLSRLAFAFTKPLPDPTTRALRSVRQAIGIWGVNMVVIAPGPPGESQFIQGHDPAYAAAFMTAALGRQPRIEAGAWVWNNVSVSQGHALKVSTSRFDDCVAYSHPYVASLAVSSCIESIVRHK